MGDCPHESGLAPVLLRIIQRPGRTLEIIDEISDTKPPFSVVTISEELGVPRSNVSRVVNNLASNGVTPKSMYSLKRLAVSLLSVLHVGFHDASSMDRGLQALSKTVIRTSLGVYSSYFIPRSLEDGALSFVASNAPPSRESLYVYGSEIIRPRPLLAETVRRLNGRVNPYLAISVAEHLADDREYLSRSSVRESLRLLEEKPHERPMVRDSLDLLILSLLERDVLASKSYAERLLRGGQVRRKYLLHLTKHVVPVVSHISFRIFDSRNEMVMVFGRGSSCVKDVIRVIMPYLYTTGILVGGDAPRAPPDWEPYNVLITLSLPPGYVAKVVSWIDGLCNWDDLRYEVVDNALKMYVKSFTIPYRMFDKSRREWRLPSLVTAV